MHEEISMKKRTSLVSAFPFIVEGVLSSIDRNGSNTMRHILWRSFALDGGPIATRASLAAATGTSHAGVEKLRNQVLESIRAELHHESTSLPESLSRQAKRIRSDLNQIGEIITGVAFRKLLQLRCGEPVHPRWFRLLAITLGYLPLQGARAGTLELRDLWISESLVREKAIDRVLQSLDAMQGTLRESSFGTLLMDLREQTGAAITTRGLTTLIEAMPALEIRDGVVRTVTSYLHKPRERSLRLRNDARPRFGHECVSPMKDMATGKTILIRHARGETPERAVARRKAMHPRHRGSAGLRSVPSVGKHSQSEAQAASRSQYH